MQGNTAIKRKGPSSPCLWLHKQERIHGPALDWGCGYGQDVRFLNSQDIETHGYEPNAAIYDKSDSKIIRSIMEDSRAPYHSEAWKFQTVLCTYVLNTIPDYFDRALVVEQIIPFMSAGSTLYVSIRADKRRLQGYTKKNTWQGYVGGELENGGFTLTHRQPGQFEIWQWSKPT